MFMGHSYNALNKIAKDYNTNPSYINSDQKLIITSGTDGFVEDVLNLKTPIKFNTKEYKEVLSIEEED